MAKTNYSLIIILFLAVALYLCLSYSTKEHFVREMVQLALMQPESEIIPNQEDETSFHPQPLKLDKTEYIDPVPHWISHDIAQVRFTIKAKQGYIDWDHVISQPGLGYPGLSRGFGHYSTNPQYSLDRWSYWNQTSHPQEWLSLQKSEDSYFWDQTRKEKEVAIVMDLNKRVKQPIFPYTVKLHIPDLYYGRRVSVNVTFLKDPFDSMPSPDTQLSNQPWPKSHTETSPLVLKQHIFVLDKNSWIMESDKTAIATIVLQADQGMIHWKTITGKEKDSPGWFSWSINSNLDLMSPQHVVVRLRIHGTEPAPSLPANYWLVIQDAHRERHVRVRITIMSNPFAQNGGFYKSVHNIETFSSSPVSLPTCQTIQNLPAYLKNQCMEYP